jgi:transketolase
MLAAEFNRPGHTVVDHRTWVFLGDGCLMEGISHEACSLAGTLGLGKLIALYDDNGISIDGHVTGWFTDDTPARFAAYGWQVIRDVDGHDPRRSTCDPPRAQARRDKPTLICCKTIIGFGSPNKAGTHGTAHGAPLGADEVAAARAALGWTAAPFEIPADIRAAWDARAPGASVEPTGARFAAYAKPPSPRACRGVHAPHGRRTAGRLGRAARCASSRGAVVKGETIATRKASQNALERARPRAAGAPRRLGRPDRLEPHATGQGLEGRQAGDAMRWRQLLHYGVREFGMAAIHERHRAARRLHPLRRHLPRVLRLRAQRAAHGGADEAPRDPCVHARLHRPRRGRPDAPARRAHGQPAHHPEHGRLAPVRRGRDGDRLACRRRTRGRSDDLLLSRQNLPHQTPRRRRSSPASPAAATCSRIAAGAPPAVVLIATGSEVALALAAQAQLAAKGIAARVVSMPSTDGVRSPGRRMA